MNANSHPIKVVSVAGSGTDEMVVNSHPIKVVEVADEGMYANDHPYKVVIEGPGPGPTPSTKDYGTLTMADYTYTLSAQSQDTTATTITITDATKAETFFRSRIGLLNTHNLGAQYNLFDGETHDYYVNFYSLSLNPLIVFLILHFLDSLNQYYARCVLCNCYFDLEKCFD